jgi:iron(III) transport system substrate-binding protein
LPGKTLKPVDSGERELNTPANQKKRCSGEETMIARTPRSADSTSSRTRRLSRRTLLGSMLAAPFVARQAPAAEMLNAYSIWPENYARPMMEAFEKASGIRVKFIRFSSGEALARVTAEKNNPQIDVLFGGPVETFTAGQAQNIFEPYVPPGAAELPARFKDKSGAWTAIADDPLVFMTNTKFLAQNNLQPPASWDDLLNPAYKNMLQMADARTSGTAVTRIFSILQVNNRDEDKAFAYMKKLRQNVQLYTKSGGGGTLPVGLGQAGGGIFFIVDALFTRQQGYDVQISFPKEGIGSAAECIALIKGAKNPEAGKKLIDWATSPAMQSLLAPNKINFIPANPKVETESGLAEVLKSANIIEIDDVWAGANRARIVQRWIAEVLNAG